MELAKEVDFQRNNTISYFEFANKMDYMDDFARKEDKIGASKSGNAVHPAQATPSSSQPPPKTAAPVRGNENFEPGDTAMSLDLGVNGVPRQQSRSGSKAASGRATPNNMRAQDSKTAYLVLEQERAIEQHKAELNNVAALPDGTPRRG